MPRAYSLDLGSSPSSLVRLSPREKYGSCCKAGANVTLWSIDNDDNSWDVVVRYSNKFMNFIMPFLWE
jgi:hypothetical protein